MVATVLALQRLDRAEHIVRVEKGRVVPAQLICRKRARRNILGDGVHLIGERVACSLRPRARHHLPRPPAEEQGLGSSHGFAEHRTHRLRVEERHRPAAIDEPAVSVFLGSARGLHDPVETDEITENDAHAELHSGVAVRCLS
jgi:hypothetical protein